MMQQLIFQKVSETRQVRDQLRVLLKVYGTVTVADLYELCGATSTYKDEKEGWRDLPTLDIEPVEGGYTLILPTPEPLK